jgi:hypothetical protein
MTEDVDELKVKEYEKQLWSSPYELEHDFEYTLENINNTKELKCKECDKYEKYKDDVYMKLSIDRGLNVGEDGLHESNMKVYCSECSYENGFPTKKICVWGIGKSEVVEKVSECNKCKKNLLLIDREDIPSYCCLYNMK